MKYVSPSKLTYKLRPPDTGDAPPSAVYGSIHSASAVSRVPPTRTVPLANADMAARFNMVLRWCELGPRMETAAGQAQPQPPLARLRLDSNVLGVNAKHLAMGISPPPRRLVSRSEHLVDEGLRPNNFSNLVAALRLCRTSSEHEVRRPDQVIPICPNHPHAAVPVVEFQQRASNPGSTDHLVRAAPVGHLGCDVLVQLVGQPGLSGLQQVLHGLLAQSHANSQVANRCRANHLADELVACGGVGDHVVRVVPIHRLTHGVCDAECFGRIESTLDGERPEPAGEDVELGDTHEVALNTAPSGCAVCPPRTGVGWW